jgi:hypothetical protein
MEQNVINSPLLLLLLCCCCCMFREELINCIQLPSTLNLLGITSNFHSTAVFILYSYKQYFLYNLQVSLPSISILNLTCLAPVAH